MADPIELHPDEVELQAAGQQGAATAPAPLQRATNDLGVRYTSAAGSGRSEIAGVEQGEPRNVEVDQPQVFKANAAQVAPHELYHIWQGNLPPALRAQIPTSTSRSDYAEPTVAGVRQLQASGKSLLDIPSEKAAQMMAWASLHHDDPQVQGAMKPYLDQMRAMPRSQIQATGPRDQQMNLMPRAPMAPPDDIPGMEGFYVQQGQGKLIPRATAEQYMARAGGDPAKARYMAAHDNHMIAPLPPKRDDYMVDPKPAGLVERGNLPIWNRPVVQNADGSHSTEYSTSFEDDHGHEVLVPTVVNGRFLTPDGKKPAEGSPAEKAMFKAAWQHYEQTGEHLGKFDNPTNADRYAGKLHNRGR